jgi:hypothetical protein
MPLLDARELLSFPSGDNTADTFIGGVNFNLTTLQFWNYTLYSNGTLSNWTNCFLIFEPYTPKLLSNGTFLNTTSCYSPIEPMGTRAFPGIGFAIFFAFSIIFTLMNLRKHGRRFLPSEKRFHPVGRRWQWYWMCFAAACGMISGLMSIDVDRYYIPEWPIVLTNIFYYLMVPSTMAAIWEAVRHWGSWEERQLIDPNPFILSQNDKRGKIEFWMPLVFYFFGFFVRSLSSYCQPTTNLSSQSFFMTVPRNWLPISYQRDQLQTDTYAGPIATDGRFKVGAICLFLSWLVIIYSLRHSIHHYKPRNRGFFNSLLGGIKYTPVRFALVIPIALVIVGYQNAIAWDFAISPLNYHASAAYIYGLGWAPIVFIFLILEIAGYIKPNEDKELIRQRRVRGQLIDAEMGYTKKPNWWRRLHGDHNLNVQETIAKNVREVKGGAAASSWADGETYSPQGIELREIEKRAPRNQNKLAPVDRTPAWRASQRAEDRRLKNLEEENIRMAASLLFPNQPAAPKRDHSYLFEDGPPDRRGRDASSSGDAGSSITKTEAVSERSASTESATTLGRPPQQVRSMLDI